MQQFTIRIVDAQRLAVITWYPAKPELAVWRAGMSALVLDPAFQPAFGVLSDWRSSTKAPNTTFVRGFVVDLQRRRRSGTLVGPWATLVSRAEVAVYGMGRMTEILLEEDRYAVFCDYDQALAWLAEHQGAPGPPA